MDVNILMVNKLNIIHTIWISIPFEKVAGGRSFSYQNRSDFFNVENCFERRQLKVGPRRDPCTEGSNNPPTSRSMSSTFLKLVEYILHTTIEEWI